MKLLKQRLSYSRGIVGDNIYMFTANSCIKDNGALVMGRGCAKTVRDIYTGVDKLFGKEIEHMSEFNIKFIKWHEQWIGAFQTKVNWQDKSPKRLVLHSTQKLCDVAKKRPQWTFHLPCPAVSNGGMEVDDVLNMIEILPDNVIVYLD